MSLSMNLTRPIAFIDLETTGINIVTDRIVEISILKISVKGEKNQKTWRVNPGMPIPKESTEIHGITDEDIKDCPHFSEIAGTIAKSIANCDMGGYNSNKFDFPLLAEEFMRADVAFDFKKKKLIDVQVIFHKMEQRTLGAAYKFYCGKELMDSHTAAADTLATYEILLSQLERYDELQNDINFISEFSSHHLNADFAGRIIYDKDGIEIFNFGKYKGQKVEEVLEKDPAYYGWMMKGEFPLYTKKILTQIKLRKLGK